MPPRHFGGLLDGRKKSNSMTLVEDNSNTNNEKPQLAMTNLLIIQDDVEDDDDGDGLLSATKSVAASTPSSSASSQSQAAAAAGLHPGLYVLFWIVMSSSVIIFNNYILHDAGFPYPVFLTMWHQVFATIATQILAVTTPLVDARHSVNMDWPMYCRTIVPIGILYSLSLMTGNIAYLYLSVAFIQILKAIAPVTVLIANSILTARPIELHVFLKVSLIVLGTMIASYGELKFVLIGFILQMSGVVFESIRLVLVQILLKSSKNRMDPLCSLYYYAPVCATMNFLVALYYEPQAFTFAALEKPGYFLLLVNAIIAFVLNLSSVLLIGKTSSLVLCLSGVLKNIIIVFISIFMWGTPVTLLQFFGCSISSIGLIIYQLGVPSVESITETSNMVLAGLWEARGAARIVMIVLAWLGVVTELYLLVLNTLSASL